MQGILVFASAAARDAAITAPAEGQFAYLKDTNVTTYYTGSAWANVDTTGMTNPMTTTGDTIYSSSGSTPARLGIGTAGQVLQVNSGATAPEWATPAAPSTAKSFTLVSTTTTNTGASFTISGLSGYDEIRVILQNVRTNDTGNNAIRLQMNGDTTSANYRQAGFSYTPSSSFSGTTLTSVTISEAGFKLCNHGTSTSMDLNGFINIAGANKSGAKLMTQATGVNENGNALGIVGGGFYSGTSVISSIVLITAGGSFTSGTMYVYGAQ
jgi:hypothetical protein